MDRRWRFGSTGLGGKNKACGVSCVRSRPDDPDDPDDPDCLETNDAKHCNANEQCTGGPPKLDECLDSANSSVCAGLSDTQCQATPDCEMALGRRLNQERRCRLASAKAGCTSGDCGDGAIAYAQDEGGRFWWFASYCFPDGWTEKSSVDMPEGSDRWPTCATP